MLSWQVVWQWHIVECFELDTNDAFGQLLQRTDAKGLEANPFSLAKFDARIPFDVAKKRAMRDRSADGIAGIGRDEVIKIAVRLAVGWRPILTELRTRLPPAIFGNNRVIGK